jgi:thiamine-phosphate pyrophosphorylase
MVNSTSSLDLVLITDRKICEVKFTDIIMQAVDGGVGTVQLREKDLKTRDLYKLAKVAREITNKKNVKLIINDRVDVAIAVNADGVHLGWQSLDIDIARRMIGQDKLIGFSAHSLKDAESAEKSGADYISISPIFDTTHKDFFVKPFGVDGIGKIKELVNVPVIALGGINENNVEEVLENGADGIAVISAIILSDNPEKSATNLCRKIKNYKSEL